jgi:putative DNA primase/helicase
MSEPSVEPIQITVEPFNSGLNYSAAEPEILLPVEECFDYEEVKIGKETFRVAKRVKIHKTADEVLNQISIVTVEETGAMLYYKDGVYVEGGEAKIETLLHKSFHGYECFDPRSTPVKIISHLKGITKVSNDRFDENLDIFNMKNGLYNWRESKLYNHSPEYFSRAQVPVIYDAEAECPRIETIFNRVMKPADIAKFVEFVSYCLYRSYPIQKAFILLGPGQTGKSYVLDVLRNFVGDANSCSVSLTSLTNNRFAGSDLYGKLLDVVNEMDTGTLLSSETFKQITGGSKDPIRAERKYEHGFTFINFAKLVFATNKLPKTLDETTGFYRRFEIIRCDHVFTNDEYDPETLDHLTDSEELSGLFNLAIKELPSLLDRREFKNTQTPDQIKEIWQGNAETIVDFVDRFIDANSPDNVTTKATLYEWFIAYCELIGATEAKWSDRKFGSQIRQVIPEFKDRRHDEAFRPKDGGRVCKVWYDARFKIDEFEKFKRDIEKAKKTQLQESYMK